MAIPGARLDFNEDELIAIDHDEIQFASLTVPVSGHESKASTFEPGTGVRFTALPTLRACGGVRHVTRLCTH